MLHDTWLLKRLPDIRSRDLDMSASLPGVIQQDAVPDDLGFPLCEVAPAAHGDQWSAIASFGGHKKCKHDSDEQGNDSLN